MKHIRAAAKWAHLGLDSDQEAKLSRFGHWLADEGHRAGGIGPAEVERIEQRHLADSLLFATLLPGKVDEVWDLGTGLGLPGVPLAIVLPNTRFLLIDRSDRRTTLLRRLIRILELDNCEVLTSEFKNLKGFADAVVSRASIPPPELLTLLIGHLRPGGVGITAGSWWQRPEHAGWSTVEIPRDVLDRTIWLLIMRRQ